MRKLLIAILTILLVTGSSIEAKKKTRTSSSVKKERVEANKQANRTKEKIAATKKELNTKINNLNSLTAKIDQTNAKISELKVQINVIDDSINAVTNSIDSINGSITKIKESTSKSLRESRARKQSLKGLGIILSSKDFTQAMKRISYLRQLDKSLAKKATALEQNIKALEKKKAKLADLRNKQAQTLSNLDTEQQRLTKSQADMRSLVADLKSQAGALETELKKRQAQVSNLDSELEKLIAQEQAEEAARIKKAEEEARRKAEEEQRRLAAAEEAKRKAEAKAKQRAEEEAKQKALADAKEQQNSATQLAVNTPAPAQPKQGNSIDSNKKKSTKSQDKKKTDNKQKQDKKQNRQGSAPKNEVARDNVPPAPTVATATMPTVGPSFEKSKGRLPNPVKGKFDIVGKFGRNRHAALSRVELDNPGIDIETTSGAQALAVYDGVVSSIYFVNGYHNIVMVRHGEYITIYANIANLLVKKGDKVKAGQAIGSIYSDPEDEGRSILHFEVRKEKEKLNPQEWIVG